MDHGHITGPDFDHDLEEKRRRFEELLGNANGYAFFLSASNSLLIDMTNA